MKKLLSFIFIALLLLMLFSCNENKYKTSKLLNEVNYSSMSFLEASKVLTKDIKEKLSLFSGYLTELVYKENKDNNFVFSPLSLYFGLTMLHTIGDQNMQSEIEEFLGMSAAEINKTGAVIDSLKTLMRTRKNEREYNSAIEIANSIWLDKNLEIKQEGLQELADVNKADAFYTSFSDKNKQANQDINKYIKNKTHGLIDQAFNFSERTIFVLINTIYCQDCWLINGNLETSQGNFYGLTKSEIREFLTSKYSLGRIRETEYGKYYHANTSGSIELMLFIPNDGYSLEDMMKKEFINEMNMSTFDGVDEETETYYYTRAIFPSYEVKTDFSFMKALKNNNLLPSVRSKFDSKINYGDTYISDIIQSSALNVTKEGIEGTSITMIPGFGSAAPKKEVYEDFLVNKSFGYFVAYNDIIIFAGQIVD